MTDDMMWFEAATLDSAAAAPAIDTTLAHLARVYDYWLGGKDNFPADRIAAEEAIKTVPGLRRGVRAQRLFLQKAVQYMAGQVGIRQFLDIGTGIPTANNTHEVAQDIAPECRVVYVDNDPLVLAQARVLLTSSREGATAFLQADLRDVDTILDQAGKLLDFHEPIALMLIGILQLIPDEDNPSGIVARLLDALPSGSWLAVVQPTGDVQGAQMTRMVSQLNKRAATPTTLRTRSEITRFFDGTELLPPGVVQLHQWDPAGAPVPDPGEDIPAYGGLGRKT